MRQSARVGFGIAAVVMVTAGFLVVMDRENSGPVAPGATETVKPMSTVASEPASILGDPPASEGPQPIPPGNAPIVPPADAGWPPALEPVGPARPPVVASAGGWQVVSTRSMLGIPAADLAGHASFGLQIRGSDPGSPVVEFSLNRQDWVALPALGGGHWTARRPFRTWQVKLPRSTVEASKLVPLWVRVQGLSGEVLTALRF